MLGLGEAGSAIAADLVAAGLDVRGHDPGPGRDVPGLRRTAEAAAAVAGVRLVLSLNTGSAAADAAMSALPALGPTTVYADLNTSSPELKRRLAAIVGGAGAPFADVALLGPVPGRGLRTPAVASGTGARAVADLLQPLGMPVEVISEEPGDASTLKLLRSVFMKGVAAAAIESVEGAEAAGQVEWVKREIAGVIGEALLERLLEGSRTHAARRTEEMEAACELLQQLGVEPRIADAAGSVLAALAASPPGA